MEQSAILITPANTFNINIMITIFELSLHHLDMCKEKENLFNHFIGAL